MNKLNVLKKTVALVVTIGTGSITKQIIDHNTDEPTTNTEKVTRYAGSFAIGGAISAAATAHTDRLIDELAANFADVKSNIDAAKQAKS